MNEVPIERNTVIEIPDSIIEAFLNSKKFLSAQLDWAEYRLVTIAKDTEEYTQGLEDLRKAEIAYENQFGAGHLYGRKLVRRV